MRFTFLLTTVFLFGNYQLLVAQCCSGGGGGASSLAGNFAQGVLAKNQFEINMNFQHTNTQKFMTGNSRMEMEDYHALASNNYLHGYNNNFLYTRLGFGLTDKLTLSVETGYYLNKTEYRRGYLVDEASSTGFSDLIIFPKYNVFYRKTEKHTTEITLGMGIKIPVGSHNDSILVYTDSVSGVEWYDTKSPSIQLSSGSNDFQFFGSVSRRFIPLKMGISLSSFYIHKGRNPDGGKYGNYFSTSLFAMKDILPNFVGVAQFKSEVTGTKTKPPGLENVVSSADLAANSGSIKFMFVPRLVYTLKCRLSFFVFTEIPMYQYVTGIQLASNLNAVLGVSFRTSPKAKPTIEPEILE